MNNCLKINKYFILSLLCTLPSIAMKDAYNSWNSNYTVGLEDQESSFDGQTGDQELWLSCLGTPWQDQENEESKNKQSGQKKKRYREEESCINGETFKTSESINKKSKSDDHDILRNEFGIKFANYDQGNSVILFNNIHELKKHSVVLGSAAALQKINLIFIVLLDSLGNLIESSKELRAQNKGDNFHIWQPNKKWEMDFIFKLGLVCDMLNLSLESHKRQHLLTAADLHFKHEEIEITKSKKTKAFLEYAISLNLHTITPKEFTERAIRFLITPKTVPQSKPVQQHFIIDPVVYNLVTPAPQIIAQRKSALSRYR